MDERAELSPSPLRSEGNNLRRDTRDEVFLRTMLSCGRKIGIGGQLVNISTSGFMVRTLEAFAPDSIVRILLPLAGEVPARVVWAMGGRVGCAFESPFDDKLYPKLLVAIRSAKPDWAKA
jgi:hypothetical protein